MIIQELLFLLVVFLSNIIQAITGFAGTLLAMPASIKLIGVNEAKGILNIMGLLASILIAVKSYKNVDKKELIKIVLIMLCGVVIGIWLFKKLPTTLLLYGYGIMIILIALKKLFVKKEIDLSESVLNLILLFAGIIHGMFVSGGALLVVYAAIVFKEKVTFRSTLSAVWIILNGYMLMNHIHAGYFDGDSIKLVLLCIPFLVCGVMIGTWLHHKMNQGLFMKLTYILLLFSGLMLLK